MPKCEAATLADGASWSAVIPITAHCHSNKQCITAVLR